MDVLSSLLRSIQLDAAIYFNAEFHAPWCAQAGYGMPAEQLQRLGADHIVFFHCLIEGECQAQLAEGSAAVPLRRGDLVLFPHDARHLLGSDVSLPAFDATQRAADTDPHQWVQLRIDGSGPLTRFVCGYLACNRQVCRGLLSALPEMLVVSLTDQDHSAWLLDLLELGVQESIRLRPGAQSLLTKLSELLFTEALRRLCQQLPPGQPGWLAGLQDPLVGRALSLLHNAPAQRWSVEALARASATSRSVLAERFQRLLGVAPMQYLASHRLALAAQQLRSAERSVAAIANAVGYDSEAAFTRAFKREYGQPPSHWRKGPKVAETPR